MKKITESNRGCVMHKLSWFRIVLAAGLPALVFYLMKDDLADMVGSSFTFEKIALLQALSYLVSFWLFGRLK